MFKDKLKEEMDNYEIKLTSEEILEKFHHSQSKKTAFNYRPLLAYGLSFAILLGGGIILLNNLNNPNNSSSNSTPYKLNTKYANILSLEVMSSLGFIEESKQVNLVKRKNEISKDTFEKICLNFKENYQTLSSSLDYKNNFVCKVNEGEYIINDNTYTYQITLDEDKYLYFSIDTKNNDRVTKEKYKGYLELNNNYYSFSGLRKLNTNNNEDEIDIKIQISNNKYIEIEQETERSESSYSYSIIENNIEIYELEIDFENDEIEMECKAYNEEFEYEITQLNNSFSIEYTYSINENEDTKIEGTMNLTIENGTFSFFDEKNSLNFVI